MTTRRAVITGAGQGSGRAIAQRLSQNGIHTLLVGRTASKLHDTAEAIAAAGGEATARAGSDR